MTSKNEQEFDAFANDYRDILKNNLKSFSAFKSEYFAEYKIQALKDSLNFSPKNILDFGCGDGISCEFFNKYFPESTISGIDVSSESIKIAQNKKIPSSSFLLYDGDKLPFEDNSFDLIFASGVFHHIEKQKHHNIAKEINRVLNKNGKLFIFEHNPINPFTKKVVKDCVFDKNAELLLAKSFKKTFQESNFQDIKINYTLFFPRYNLFKNFFSLEKYLTKCPLGAQYYLEASKTI